MTAHSFLSLKLPFLLIPIVGYWQDAQAYYNALMPVFFEFPLFTPHDIRRSTASHMTAMQISRLVVGKILNHTEPGITAVYDRHSYDNEKRKALDAWSRKLGSVLSGKKADVISINSHRK